MKILRAGESASKSPLPGDLSVGLSFDSQQPLFQLHVDLAPLLASGSTALMHRNTHNFEKLVLRQGLII